MTEYDSYVSLMPHKDFEQVKRLLPNMESAVQEIGQVESTCEICGITGFVRESLLEAEEGETVHVICVRCAEKGEDPTWMERAPVSKKFLDVLQQSFEMAPPGLQRGLLSREIVKTLMEVADGFEEDVPDDHPVLDMVAGDFWNSFAETSPESAAILKEQFFALSAKGRVLLILQAVDGEVSVESIYHSLFGEE